MTKIDFARLAAYEFDAYLFADELPLEAQRVLGVKGSDKPIKIHGEFTVEFDREGEPVVRIEYVNAWNARNSFELTADDIDFDHLIDYICDNGNHLMWHYDWAEAK